jgi:UDP-3-O-[3-hydroxymyristoyl] glucosamine N-acyltransferase
MAVRLDEIVARFGGTISGPADLLVGAGDTPLHRIAPLDIAGPGDLAFLANPKYRQQLATTRASAVIVAPSVDDCPVLAIVVPQPYLYFARVAQWMNPPPPVVAGCHASAVVEGVVDPSASVGANAWIGAGAQIGAGVVIGANCSIGEGVQIEAGVRVFPNVSIYANCVIGERTVIHSGAVIGGDGFGYAPDVDRSWLKIPQVGRVVIGADVEIGAATTIDRGALLDTVIEDGVKIDNLVQIAHNVRIGAHTAIAGCTGIAGSATIGKRCTLAGASMISGHLTICDDVIISAATLITKSIAKAGMYSSGIPFLEHNDWLKNFSKLRHLDAMADKIRALEKRLADLEKKSS